MECDENEIIILARKSYLFSILGYIDNEDPEGKSLSEKLSKISGKDRNSLKQGCKYGSITNEIEQPVL